MLGVTAAVHVSLRDTLMAYKDDQQPLYRPINPQDTATFRFLSLVNSTHNLRLSTYHDLYNWSTAYVDKFWSLVWDFTGVVGHKGAHVVDNSAPPSANPPWYDRFLIRLSPCLSSRRRFSGAKLNWAENMLRCRRADKVALIQASLSNILMPLMHLLTYHSRADG